MARGGSVRAEGNSSTRTELAGQQPAQRTIAPSPARRPTLFADETERRALTQDLDVDVCVVGGGLAGLSVAREIARRRVLAHRRSARREQPCDPELVRCLAEAAERVEERRPVSVQQAALMACLEKLPSHSRRLIVARYDGSVDGAEELAGRFGRSVQGIYAQIKRIKQALRQCVERRLAAEG